MRYANKADLKQIIELFEDCFPEDTEFTKWFFENEFNVNNTIIYEIDNKIAAMLQLLPYSINASGEIIDVHYIYGACTHIHYRKQGYMSKLLQFIDKDTILIPANDSLYEFYAKAGFETVFYNYKTDININDSLNDNMNDNLCITNDCNTQGMLNLYNKPNRIIRNKLYFDGQIKLTRYLGGDVLCIEEDKKILGYAFVYENETYVEISEIICNSKYLLNIFLQKIAKKYKKNHIKYINDEYGVQTRIGMIRAKKQINNIYMNLMFN